MRTTRDVLRSMVRYAGQVLGPEWEVRRDREDGTFSFPFCHVFRTGPMLMRGPVHSVDITVPISWHCYPPPGETMEASQDAAMGVEELLFQGLRVGVGLGRPLRVPLFDYEALSNDEGSEARGPRDFMRVVDVGLTQVPDLANDRLIAVVADMRVSWVRAAQTSVATQRETDDIDVLGPAQGALSSGSKVAQEVRERFSS